MNHLRVSPADLHRTGVEVRQLAKTLHAELSAADQQIAASHGGWVGKSAAALAAMAAEWEEATKTHHQNIADHGEKFTGAARMYGHVDDSQADALRNAADAFEPGAR